MLSHSASAACVHSTRFGSGGYARIGTVTNRTLDVFTFLICSARFDSCRTLARSGSVVSDFVAASRNPSSRSGRSSSPLLVASRTTADRNACCRPMRLMSDPSPMCRTRTNARAWLPLTFVVPAGRSRWLLTSFTGWVRQTSTPPSASTICLNPSKFSTA
ncbi:hypothetical protein GCM10025868_20400 [Angustibacter aerolatus]|uniref:Uncharacterized protein n=1 Tax=Angustibacter aerolatus TaxID=1162965 RepID=A0ABQ6JF38_9ACTN|nr:hypothetical protein GCM10025868_20400 [Angustibacter aerolatus]